MSQTLAVFDFDKTLTRYDSMLPWLMALRGKRRASKALMMAFRDADIAIKLEAGRDRRWRMKANLLARALAGIPVEHAMAAAEEMDKPRLWRPDTCAVLEAHRDAGHRILVLTGATTLCCAVLMKRRFGGAEVVGTELAAENGILTGRMAGPNMARQEKVRYLTGWLEAEGPFHMRYGYGNAPHDEPMLALVDHPTIVARKRIPLPDFST